MPSERFPAPNVASCSAYETGSVTVLRRSGSRYCGGRPAPGRRPPRVPRGAFCIDSIIHNHLKPNAAPRALQGSTRSADTSARELLGRSDHIVVVAFV